ncbi:MAG: FG-GAP repeat domain-containing protein [Limisphaerales bacterium]
MRHSLTLTFAALLVALPSIPSSGADSSAPAFEKRILTDKYYCDGIGTGDFNRDGKPDIVAGPFWYEGPDFETRHEFRPAMEFPTRPAPTDSLFSYVHDFNGDGWPDILVLGRVHLHPAAWYANPQGKPGHWTKHFAFERVRGESPPFLDVDGDGHPELVAHWNDQWGLIQPDRTAPEAPWRFKPITENGQWNQFHHGTGIGDINGDQRPDLILNEGWWEQPADGTAPWKAHPFIFSKTKGGAQMFASDVNGDGLADVITALDAHGWGLAWFEQKRSADGITFVEHRLMGDREEESKYGVCFSQPHALTLADLDGDGLKDIVVGKRMWAHPPPKDIEPDAPPVLYWFQCQRDGTGGATFVPRFIDDRSGVGVQVTTADLQGDGRPDILTVSKLGTFVFLNQENPAKPRP